MDFKMASSHPELKHDSAQVSTNGAKHYTNGGIEDVANDTAKKALLEALYFTRHQVVDEILRKHPGLSNFEYENILGFEGTPLQITCRMYHTSLDQKGIGMIFFSL